MNNKQKIVICDKCKGKGYTTKFVRIGLNDSEYQESTCTLCCGSGRLIKKVNFEPYVVE